MAHVVPVAAFAVLFGLVCRSLPAAAKERACPANEKCDNELTNDSPVNMLQVATVTKRGAERASPAASCAPLANKGMYFSVAVATGTPSQSFNVIADTGSNAFTIPDCRCTIEGGGCRTQANCFATSLSNSLNWSLAFGSTSRKVNGRVLGYGSGDLFVTVASDMVAVGGVQTLMHEGIYLIEDRHSLQMGPDFEGILGLGIPSTAYRTPLFAMESLIGKYTVCFAEDGGALQMNVQSLPNPMTNIGVVHWGLDFQGFSVASDSAKKLPFCQKDNIKYQQTTACGGIPDSGTTLMLGPGNQILALFGELCAKWDRCGEMAWNFKADPARTFHYLLLNCDTWMHEGKGIDELPSLFLHVAGREGEPQQVEIPPHAYVAETVQDIFVNISYNIFGNLDEDWTIPAIQKMGKRKICQAMFSTSSMFNPKHGPVWIFGSPLFYAATVGFGLDMSPTDGMISIENRPCTKCAASSVSSTPTGAKALRKMDRIRTPDFDLREPF